MGQNKTTVRGRGARCVASASDMSPRRNDVSGRGQVFREQDGDFNTKERPSSQKHNLFCQRFRFGDSDLQISHVPRFLSSGQAHHHRPQNRSFHSTPSLAAASHYDTLGVPTTASQSDIEAAYYRLSKQLIADCNPNSPEAVEKFKRVSEAYIVIGNPEQRREYDAHLRPDVGVGASVKKSKSWGKSRGWSSGNGFSSTSTSEVVKPDGTIETKKTVKDGSGMTSETTTKRKGNRSGTVIDSTVTSEVVKPDGTIETKETVKDGSGMTRETTTRRKWFRSGTVTVTRDKDGAETVSRSGDQSLFGQ